ncbi:MAG: YggT family protein [Chloroflexi bacterium]|nr:MAG: YggT family protein [Chloroflexota bacterium]MBL1195528.1 YggT family protein [Chloroflexota bacterium]NOH12810.1 YggT family protein [Chloroflexota bacterium]
MLIITINVIDAILQTLTWLLFIYFILSWFMSPFHPVREAVDRILNPILMPIRNLLPQTSGIDFSPMVLFLLIYLLRIVLRSFIPFA